MNITLEDLVRIVAQYLNPPVVTIVFCLLLVEIVLNRRKKWIPLAGGWLCNLLYINIESLDPSIDFFGIVVSRAAVVNLSLLTAIGFGAYGATALPLFRRPNQKTSQEQGGKQVSDPVRLLYLNLVLGSVVVASSTVLSKIVAGDYLLLVHNSPASKAVAIAMAPMIAYSLLAHVLAGAAQFRDLEDQERRIQRSGSYLILYGLLQPLYFFKFVEPSLFLAALLLAFFLKCLYCRSLAHLVKGSIEAREKLRLQFSQQARQQLAFSWFAHELKSPAHAINNYATTAQRLLQSRDHARAQRTLNKLTPATEMLLNVVDSVKIAAEPISIQDIKRISINDAIEESTLAVKNSMHVEQAWVHFDPAKGVEVLAAHVPLVQVFSNLIRNALEACAEVDPSIFAHTGGHRVFIRSRRGDAADAIVTIADLGPGINSKILESIFEPYYSTKAGINRGLGLWVVRSLIESLSGSIDVTSPVEKFSRGTKIVIRLPSPKGSRGIGHRLARGLH